jgi:hypothetical protein
VPTQAVITQVHKQLDYLQLHKQTTKKQIEFASPKCLHQMWVPMKENKMIKDDMVTLALDTTNEKDNDTYIACSTHG